MRRPRVRRAHRAQGAVLDEAQAVVQVLGQERVALGVLAADLRASGLPEALDSDGLGPEPLRCVFSLAAGITPQYCIRVAKLKVENNETAPINPGC